MDVKDAVLKRKASKIYLQEDTVNLDDIALVTDAGLWAPTAVNMQNSMILSITNKNFLKTLVPYFEKGNTDQILTCQAFFIFVGTPWKDDNLMRQMVIDHALQYWNLSDEMVEKMANGIVHYYNNISNFKDQLDMVGSSTQMGMMMLQATELGYDTNGILGFNQITLTNFLREQGLINEHQVVNLAFSMGHRDENHEKNKILTHNRIKKELLVKEVN